MNKTPSYKCNSVMLIDDNSIDNFINERLIQHFHFSEKIYVHTSAIGGLEYLKNVMKVELSSESLIPKYIFLDINLPVIDGWGFLRGYEELNLDCKIIILTNSLTPEDRVEAFSYENVIEFLGKPLTEDNLKNLP